jgi:hypothetical protein
MEKRVEPRFGTLVAVVLVFAALGTPMFLYLWETLNGLLTGHGSASRVLISLPVLALFIALLVLLGRVLRPWGTPPTPFPADTPRSRR